MRVLWFHILNYGNRMVTSYSICPETDHFSFSCSVGIAVYPNDGIDYDALLHKANQKLYFSTYAGWIQEKNRKSPSRTVTVRVLRDFLVYLSGLNLPGKFILLRFLLLISRSASAGFYLSRQQRRNQLHQR